MDNGVDSCRCLLYFIQMEGQSVRLGSSVCLCRLHHIFCLPKTLDGVRAYTAAVTVPRLAMSFVLWMEMIYAAAYCIYPMAASRLGSPVCSSFAFQY